MKLLVSTPMELVVAVDGVRHVRAEDATGAFGILPGHADFITVLVVSVVTWLNADGREQHVAVQGGTLVVRNGSFVEIATREAVREDAVRALGPAVLRRLRQERLSEEESRSSATKLHLAVIRQLARYIRPEAEGMRQGVGPRIGGSGLDRDAELGD